MQNGTNPYIIIGDIPGTAQALYQVPQVDAQNPTSKQKPNGELLIREYLHANNDERNKTATPRYCERPARALTRTREAGSKLARSVNKQVNLA